VATGKLAKRGPSSSSLRTKLSAIWSAKLDIRVSMAAAGSAAVRCGGDEFSVEWNKNGGREGELF
jgi:hypothetical protein